MIIVNRKSTIIKLLSFLSCKDIDYVWLHDDNNENLGDVDIAISQKDFNNIENIIMDFCLHHYFKLLQVIQHEFCAKYFVLGKISEEGIEYLIPDICYHYVRNGRILFLDKEILSKKIFNGEYYVSDELNKITYIFLKRSLKKNWNERHYNFLKETYYKDRNQLLIILNKYLTRKLMSRLSEATESNNLHLMNSISSKLRRSILIKTFFRNPFNVLKYYFFNIQRLVKRILNPTGLFIAIVGVDGSGKTTVINKISELLKPSFRKINLHHWKPSIFRRDKKNNTIFEPHKLPKRTFLVSLIKLLMYTVEYIIGYFTKVYPSTVRSSLVIFDRYYDDIYVDRIRFRMNLPKKIIEIVGLFIPKPNLVIFLNTEPEIVRERKVELGIDEIIRQNKEFAQLKEKYSNKFIMIKNNGEFEQTVNNVIQVIFNHLEKRRLIFYESTIDCIRL